MWHQEERRVRYDQVVARSIHVESLMIRFDVRTTSDTPGSPGADLGSNWDDESGEDWHVREAVGSLLWLSTMTQPDITDALRAVARQAILYLKGSGKR